MTPIRGVFVRAGHVFWIFLLYLKQDIFLDLFNDFIEDRVY